MTVRKTRRGSRHQWGITEHGGPAWRGRRQGRRRIEAPARPGGGGVARCAEDRLEETGPVETALRAGLRYVTDAQPGIRRRRAGRAFSYQDPDGRCIRDAKTLARLRSLVIPPAWAEVWICLYDNGHIQATGRDARGRKQYRYHPTWRAQRDVGKFSRMLSFMGALPKIRRRVNADLSLPGLPRPKVLATCLRLLEMTLIRIGNEEYARQNGSFGLTTLHHEHVQVSGKTLQFRFRGKSGKECQVSLSDPRLAQIVRRCQELPGQELFRYIAEDGSIHDVGSGDVNDYLRNLTGKEFTAKDFRTWGGTVLALDILRQAGHCRGKKAKSEVLECIRRVARQLGNTPTVCRKYYIHPVVIDAYLTGAMFGPTGNELEAAAGALRPNEAALSTLLKRRCG